MVGKQLRSSYSKPIICFVMIIKGKDKGETGIIVKKHIKQGPGHEGGIFTVEAPLNASNVQVLDPVTGKPCKVGVKYLEDGTKVTVCTAGPKDTRMDLVLEKTYDPKTGKGMPDL
ncbi:hypothetical protein CRYUN_Cryun23aG0085600 [Craigia yunnanensis]